VGWLVSRMLVRLLACGLVEAIAAEQDLIAAFIGIGANWAMLACWIATIGARGIATLRGSLTTYHNGRLSTNWMLVILRRVWIC
jgi:hypothetical protein